MNDLKQIRRQLGASIADFAEFLEVPYSTLSMAERGLRDLPSAAQVKFSELLIWFQQVPAPPQSPISDDDFTAMFFQHRSTDDAEKLNADLRRRALACEKKLAITDLRIKRMETDLEQQAAVVARLKFAAETSPLTFSDRDRRWFAEQHRLLAQTFSTKQFFELLKLRAKRQALQFERDALLAQLP